MSKKVDTIIGELDPNKKRCSVCKEYKDLSKFVLPYFATIRYSTVCVVCSALTDDELAKFNRNHVLHE